MLPPMELAVYSLLVLGVIVLPGLDMAYVLGSAVVGGRRNGMVAVAGVMAGGAVHVVMTTLGLGILVKVVPGLFTAVLWLGAAYVAWIGYQMLRAQALPLPDAPGRITRGWLTFQRGALSCLLNPKAYLFMLAVFPQFMRPERGPVWLQAVEMGLVIVLCQLLVYGSLAGAAGGAQTWLARRPDWGRNVARGVGVLLVGMAIVTASEGFARVG